MKLAALACVVVALDATAAPPYAPIAAMVAAVSAQRLQSTDTTLVNFGKNEREARSAEAIVYRYHFTELCPIGKPNPTFTYYLVNGQPPRGVMFGVHSVAFNPERLHVEQVGTAHYLTDGTQIVFNFGDKGNDARQALEAIQRLKCDRLCCTGWSGAPGLMFLARSSN